MTANGITSNFNKKLNNCVCLVTGASRGIGKGIAIELGCQGAIVYVTGTSTKSSDRPGFADTTDYATTPETGGVGTIEDTAHEVTAAGGTGIAVYCNHAIDDNVDQLMQQIMHDYGRLDILVNNCFRLPKGGTKRLYAKFWEPGGVEVWDSLHTVGLRSHFVATSKAMPLLLKSAQNSTSSKIPRPLVAMISSFGGVAYTFNVPYGVGKAGVDRLVKDMAVELTPLNICVTSFWPGVVKTERTIAAVATGDWEKYVKLPLDLAESARFTGRAIVAVATDSQNLPQKSGTYQVVAELAQEYGFTDTNGKQPPSIRSLKFLLPTYAFDESIKEKIPDWMIPDWKLPFWVMAQGRPAQPEKHDSL